MAAASAGQTVTSDTKQAEKDYLRRTAGGEWERSKPFATPNAMVSVEEAADLIHDFAVMVRLLAPRPGQRILDLGAGSCWVSDWLARIGLHPVSVDISFDMLRLGQSRLPPGECGRLAVGDMEGLPFASESFDLACCLSAIHHVPSIPAALAEICRVLQPEGRAVFLEPGADHSSTGASQAAMRDYGVLEQDIVVTDFMQQCLDAGFRYAEVIAAAYVVPGLGLSRDQWLNWRALAKKKRPRRALEKMWRAVLEFFGVGKRSFLAEEAFSIHVARVLGENMETHPIIVAYRTMPTALPQLVSYGSVIDLLAAPGAVTAGGPVTARVRVHNTGSERWRASGPTPTHVGVQLLGRNGEMVDLNYARACLPCDVMPGATCEVAIACAAPPPGSYQLKIDMVTEAVTWFELKGSPTATVTLDVTP